MATIVLRKPTTFRFQPALLDTLKAQAKKYNRSLNNYVEDILLNAVCYEPNEETKSAIEEVKAGKDLKPVDMSSLDAFIKSCSE